MARMEIAPSQLKTNAKKKNKSMLEGSWRTSFIIICLTVIMMGATDVLTHVCHEQCLIIGCHLVLSSFVSFKFAPSVNEYLYVTFILSIKHVDDF